ncbi:MAG: ABC transporter ATP-binding protein [Bacteroidota bacterium]
MNIITLNGIEKIYNRSSFPVAALKGIDLKVENGDFLAIVGPSGSGKTTLLNIIGGLDQPTRGIVRIEGTDISRMKPDELIEFRLNHIGFVFQSYNLIPVLTAKENVEFIMLLQNIPKAERDRRAVEILKSIGLEERCDSKPSELSGGQQQRVAVARALASRPSFVLADEPTANLDSASAESLLDIMEQLNTRMSMTFLFSTHDPRVMKRAHRIIKLEDGLIVSETK